MCVTKKDTLLENVHKRKPWKLLAINAVDKVIMRIVALIAILFLRINFVIVAKSLVTTILIVSTETKTKVKSQSI